MIHNLWSGLTALGSVSGVLYLVAGALVGMIMGVIPGIGGPVILSIMLSFVLHIGIDGTLCLFLGTYAGSYFSASMTSILLNTPAHPEAFAVTLDGFPMAQKGQAGRALGLSATATCVGGLIGCGVLLGFLQFINYLPNLFHPPEYVALVVLAILLVGTLGTDSVGKAVISMGLGLAIASVGPSIITGSFRYTFGNPNLYGGFSLVSLTLGLFAVPQMAMVFGTKTAVASQDMTGRAVTVLDSIDLESGFGRQAIAGVFEAFRHWRYLVLGGLVGSLTGLVPGVGGFAANFMSYGTAQQVSRNGDKFGTGVPEGVIAPEASSLSKEAGSMIPILGLGVPGSVGGALLLAALTVKGLRTGYGFSEAYPVLPYEMLWIIALAGIIGTVAGLIAVPLLARVTKIPGPVLVLFIYGFAVLGSYLADISFFACTEVFVFGFVGLVLRRLRYSLASFVLGLILGPTFEANIHLTHTIYPGMSFLVDRPLADVIFLLAIATLVAKVRQVRRAARLTRQPAQDPRDASLLDSVQEAAGLPPAADEVDAYPFMALATTAALLAGSIWFVAYGTANYDVTTALMPIIGGLLIAVPAAIRLPFDIRSGLRFGRARRTREPLPDPGPGEAGRLPGASPSEPGAGALVPQAATGGSAVAVLRKPARRPASGRWSLTGQYTRECIAFAWLAGTLAACYLVGFSWGVGAFALAYGLTCTREYFRSWSRCAIFSALSAAALYFAGNELFDWAHVAFASKFGT